MGNQTPDFTDSTVFSPLAGDLRLWQFEFRNEVRRPNLVSQSAKPTILHWLSLRPPNFVSSFFIHHSSFFILIMALCKPAATELKSKNAHGLSPIYHGVFARIRFLIFLFDLNFDFRLILIVP